MSGIYIHIPFCKQACSYCDFYFVTRDQLIPIFVDALVNEIMSDTILPDFCSFSSEPMQTIYLGGGTPSRLSLDQFERLIDVLRQRFDLSRLCEFTVEVNPEDISAGYLHGLKHLGVTRLSIGVQSFQPDLLEFMHRAHTSRQAHHALELVSDTGFTSFSVDLIFGNPRQTMKQLRDDLRQLLAYRPPHISAYALSIEPKTRLGKQHKLGRLKPADDDDVAAQFHLIREKLEKHDIRQYEVSNFAKHGHEAVHNSAYWQHENYLGLGPAAHSFFWAGDRKSAIRFNNSPDIHAYGQVFASQNPKKVNQPEIRESFAGQESLTLQTLANERIMMGLRTREGVSESELSSRYNYSLNITQRKQLELFRKEGLVAPVDPLRLTAKGIVLVDAIILKLL